MATLEVLDHDELISLSFDDLLKYHGRSSIGGVAHGFKVLERALPILGSGKPPERYDIQVETAFPGPGARDAFEMVARAVTGERYRVAPELGADAPVAPQGRYFFRLGYRGATVDLTLRPGFASEELVQLARLDSHTPAQEERFTWLKHDMASRLMALPAEEVYDAGAPAPSSAGYGS
ncbi:MAG TPA: hypothetical protein VK988_09245 [Acidimicrobiales bacterium]|nr:hypothetical protein [Acidimicrobiales bacterium]